MAFPKDDRMPHAKVAELASLPVIDTPFTRMSEHWFSHQYGPCKDFEMDYMRCAGRVGLKHEETKCKEYLEDWMECAFKVKSVKRYVTIQDERKAQGLPHKKPPPADSVDVAVN